MHESKYEIVEGLNYYICDSIPTDDDYPRKDKKISTIKALKKFNFNLELQKLSNVAITKEQKDSKFHQDLENLMNFYKNARVYRDINGNRITHKGEIIPTPYQKMIKVNEEIKNFYEFKNNKTISPFIVKNNKNTDSFIFNNKKSNDRLIKLQNLKKNSLKKLKILDNSYKIETSKNEILPKKNNYTELSQICPDLYNMGNISRINNVNKENNRYCLSEISTKKSQDNTINLTDKKIENSISNFKKAKNYSNLNPKVHFNKYFYDSDFNEINKWELKLLSPNVIDQYSQKHKTTCNFSCEKKDNITPNRIINFSQKFKNYDLIQFNMNQLLKKDLRHKDKYILNMKKNLYDKKGRLSEILAKKGKNFRNNSILSSIKKGYTLTCGNTCGNKMEEYFNSKSNKHIVYKKKYYVN